MFCSLILLWAFEQNHLHQDRFALLRDKMQVGERFEITGVPVDYILEVRRLVNTIPGLAAHSLVEQEQGVVLVTRFK
jgi:hypothetical protein